MEKNKSKRPRCTRAQIEANVLDAGRQLTKTNMKQQSNNEMQLLQWAKELQFIAQAGLTYSQDPFDLERFERIREISAEIMSAMSGLTLEKVKGLFCNETGFQTPKLDTRAAIFDNEKILLVKENDSRWSLPGGWVDANQTLRSNTEKEIFEEAGLKAKATRLIALHDMATHNRPMFAYNVCKVFVLCEAESGHFKPNIETIASSYFSVDELPPLAEEKNSKEQIEMCFAAHQDENWEVRFD